MHVIVYLFFGLQTVFKNIYILDLKSKCQGIIFFFDKTKSQE